MAKFSFDSEGLVVDWVSFNLEGLVDSKVTANRLSKYFIPHVLVNDVPEIRFHGFRKKYIISSNLQKQRVTGLVLRLSSLVKMLITSINFSKLEFLIGVF
uniref:hypothetical protein n=1 Tax=Nitzschia traheaformis TaxID=1881117 RepID=UPI001EFA042F|nr:hypothetical protein MKU15_pgp065 [Nitzschia traheaformis]ULD15890.1 hypothetical protein [Nitzschia traheaformis]